MTSAPTSRVRVALVTLVAARPASAQDSVLGTFTVAGKTTKFTQVYATMEASPSDARQKYLILLVTDAPVDNHGRGDNE